MRDRVGIDDARNAGEDPMIVNKKRQSLVDHFCENTFFRLLIVYDAFTTTRGSKEGRIILWETLRDDEITELSLFIWRPFSGILHVLSLHSPLSFAVLGSHVEGLHFCLQLLLDGPPGQ